MKKLLVQLFILSLILGNFSCRVYKAQSDKKIETWNTRHLKKINGPRHPRPGGTYRSYHDFKTNKK